jgi:hypothetical protein
MRKIWILLFALLLLAGSGYGQSTKKKAKKKKGKAKSEKQTPRFEQQSNAYAPFSPEETKQVAAPSKTKRSKKNKKSAYENFNITMEQKVGEFNERMESNIKARKKQAKQMEKPQYSDPSYFGHKRKPKIRKVKNRKFCKECGITH